MNKLLSNFGFVFLKTCLFITVSVIDYTAENMSCIVLLKMVLSSH